MGVANRLEPHRAGVDQQQRPHPSPERHLAHHSAPSSRDDPVSAPSRRPPRSGSASRGESRKRNDNWGLGPSGPVRMAAASSAIIEAATGGHHGRLA